MSLIVSQNIDLAPHTTLKVGGTAKYFVVAKTKEDIKAAWQQAKALQVLPFVLGGGSNVLIDDGLVNRLVIKNELKGIGYDDSKTDVTLVTAAAGEDWDSLVETSVSRGLSGLENLSGIPGTVGACPVQNINAYGASVADVIEAVEVYDGASDEFKILSNLECRFGYRDSIFKSIDGKALIVTAVTFRLDKTIKANLSYQSASQSIDRFLTERAITEPTLADIREAILHVRGNIGMLEGQFRSAGSFFKNTIVSEEKFLVIQNIVDDKFSDISQRMSPWHWKLSDGTIKIATAFLLECSPYNKNSFSDKKFNGVVSISPKHSLSIVTFEGAKAVDVKNFVSEITAEIKNIFSISIESEVNFIF